LILPVLVTALLSSTVNAWFYVAWMIANVIYLFPNALTIVLHAMNSAQPSTLAHKARVTMICGLVITIAANCVLQFAPQQVLGVFGKVYAEQATWTLRILVLAAFPLTIKYHYIAICRIQDRITQAMLGMLPGGLLELAAATLGARLGGLTGLSLGWVVAISLEAMFMTHTVYKTLLSSETSTLATGQPAGTEAVSLVETVSMSAIEQTSRAREAIWFMETSVLPVVRLPVIKEPDTDKKPLLHKITLHDIEVG
jgi:O-antigen/teichoic acid export membrane protein